ncbi:MAG: hypothetical protein L0229_27705 [Blastocatellia bacterium]|nr:hypothetical protein [Blastocatellia bacterium]
MTTATSCTERIATIIKQRQPQSRKVENVQEHLRALSNALDALAFQRDILIGELDEPQVIGRLKDIDLSIVQRKIAAELDLLERLKRRFSRDSLNIGVVGRARQGKSKLLQSLTGLTHKEIPDGDRQHCTGVRSFIYHNPNVPAYGDIWFYSERAFIEEVIRLYYSQLNLGVAPNSIDVFISKPLPPLPDEFRGQATPSAKYEHLRRYKDHVDKYKPLFQAQSPHRIATDRIREYVAQDTEDGQRIYFNYLAVQDVKIVCRFPFKDVGQIALIDMPGIGDTGIGDPERLVKTLGEDVDIILFVRMPKSIGDYWADYDVQLYDLAVTALTELPLERWSFMVLNRTSSTSNNGDNAKNCADLKETMSEKHIKVIDCITADCSDANDVRTKILDRILSYLTANITELDNQYALSCQDRLYSLHNEIATELEKARLALGRVAPSSGEFPLFEKLFKRFWTDLTNELMLLLKEIRANREEKDPILEEHIAKAIRACEEDSGIPSIDEIETLRNRVGAYGTSYNIFLDKLRTRLTQHFLPLDDALRLSMNETKARVSNVIIKSGHLGGLVNSQGPQFLKDMAALIPEDYISIKNAFCTLAEFELSYRGFLHYRIRLYLDTLTPDQTALVLSSSPTAQDVSDYLRSLYEETVWKVSNALAKWITDPNQVAFAITEEFIDQILRAESVEGEWRNLCYEMRADIWPSDFQKLGEKSRLRREWEDSIDIAVQSNRKEGFQISDD